MTVRFYVWDDNCIENDDDDEFGYDNELISKNEYINCGDFFPLAMSLQEYDKNKLKTISRTPQFRCKKIP